MLAGWLWGSGDISVCDCRKHCWMEWPMMQPQHCNTATLQLCNSALLLCVRPSVRPSVRVCVCVCVCLFGWLLVSLPPTPLACRHAFVAFSSLVWFSCRDTDTRGGSVCVTMSAARTLQRRRMPHVAPHATLASLGLVNKVLAGGTSKCNFTCWDSLICYGGRGSIHVCRQYFGTTKRQIVNAPH